MAMTYGLPAAVPVAEELLPRIVLSVGSLYGITMPQARAPPIKKTPNRKYIVLNARLRFLRGSGNLWVRMKMKFNGRCGRGKRIHR